MQPRGTMAGNAGGQGRVFDATLSDGNSAAGRAVRVRIMNEGLRIDPADRGAGEAGGHELWPWRALVSNGPLLRGEPPLLGHRQRPGVRLFIRDPAVVDVLLAHAPQLSSRIHRVRASWPLLALVVALGGLAVWLWFSSFSLARVIADLLPASLYENVGRMTLRQMTDGRICTAPAGQRALRRLHRVLIAGSNDGQGKRQGGKRNGAWDGTRVMVAPLGMVNAFTLPGSYVVLSEGLIEAAHSVDEVSGVLAHELGHAARRHPEASLVRAGGLSLVGAVVFGDSSLGSLATLLAQLGFSRHDEEEADAFAAQRMRAAGQDPARLADFLQRVAGDNLPADGKTSRVVEMLSTHPLTRERVRFLRAQHLPAAHPALSAEEWRALREICRQKAPLEQALKARAP